MLHVCPHCYHKGCRFTMQVTIHVSLLLMFCLCFEEIHFLFDSGKRQLLDIMIGKCTEKVLNSVYI